MLVLGYATGGDKRLTLSAERKGRRGLPQARAGAHEN